MGARAFALITTHFVCDWQPEVTAKLHQGLHSQGGGGHSRQHDYSTVHASGPCCDVATSTRPPDCPVC